ncbi:hypothetical protein E4K10_48270 [Streptomyces sp. T1317-0309]|nr:hypothetical protein E4K10_48270 [Streptomyces sp. T1317-0309]
MPLSPAQEDLWVFEMLHPRTAALHLCIAYHFDAPVEPEQLSAALTMVQDNNDVLRVRVSGDTTDPGSLRMDFPPTGPFRWNDWTCAPAAGPRKRSSSPSATVPSTSRAENASSGACSSPSTTSVRSAALPAPHDHRLVVVRRPAHPVRRRLPSGDGGRRPAAALGGPVRRLRLVAARVEGGRCPRRAARLLGELPGRPTAPLPSRSRAATEEFGIAQVPFAMDAGRRERYGSWPTAAARPCTRF